jgi:hypothetical protein
MNTLNTRLNGYPKARGRPCRMKKTANSPFSAGEIYLSFFLCNSSLWGSWSKPHAIAAGQEQELHRYLERRRAPTRTSLEQVSDEQRPRVHRFPVAALARRKLDQAMR